MNFIKYAAAFGLTLLLAACGGGGGNPGTPSGGYVPPVAKPNVQIYNSANAVVSNVTMTGGNYVVATFVDSKGVALVGRTVTFSVSDPALAVLSATSALTNSVGAASVLIAPANASSGGAATVTASATDSGGTVYTGSSDFAVTPSTVVANPRIQIFNSANVAVSNVTVGAGNYVVATFVDSKGAALVGKTVTFSLNASSLAVLSPDTALTDSAGSAKVSIAPVSVSSVGAATVTATATDSAGKIYTGSADFGVSKAAVDVNPYIQFFNAANEPVSNVTFGGGNYVVATFVDNKGAPLAGRTVTFSLNGATIAVISPSNTTLTNASGAARVLLAPASVSSAGAATLTASATDSAGTSYTNSVDFGVSPASVVLSPLTLGNTALNAGGNTSVSISATSNGVAAAGVNISLSADCGTVNTVTNTVITTDGSGKANATYSSVKIGGSSCSGNVTLTASASGASVTKTAVLTVAAPVANAINFVSAAPAQIFVKSSGAVDQSMVQFKVLDSNGVAMPNIPVVFSLTVNPGGVGLGSTGSLGNVTVNSDALGIASVVIFSGTIPGPVEIKAELASNAAVFTLSKNLTVASGPPSQNHLSLSVETFNIEGWSRDGSSTNLTVRVADRQGNPVPDGTVINFTAEGGQVAPSCATKLDASNHAICSVAFISQEPRPLDGRVTVLAHAEGLKEYIDVNGNNAYDAGIDTLVDIGDAYRDANENGQYDIGEFVIPKGGTQACAGAGGVAPARANTCTGSTVQAATVRSETVLLFASSAADFTVTRNADSSTNSVLTIRVNSADHPLLPMPAGTKITSDCAGATFQPGVVPNISAGTMTSQLGSSHSISYPSDSKCRGKPIIISAESPSGYVTTFTYFVPGAPLVCTPPAYELNGACYTPPVVVPDTTPPTFPVGDPAIDQITKISFRLSAVINETGTGYYLVQDITATPGAICPAISVLLLSTTTMGMSANTAAFKVIKNLEPATIAVPNLLKPNNEYQVCFVAKDSSGNPQTTVTTVGPITTLP
jgi:hypothetical protein